LWDYWDLGDGSDDGAKERWNEKRTMERENDRTKERWDGAGRLWSRELMRSDGTMVIRTLGRAFE
jgi:hypothetical protein